MATQTARRSVWLDTSAETSYPVLEPGLSVDVAVLGGGITGLATALMLKRDGFTVAVLEATRLGTGVTGHTTGKLTSLHGLVYDELISSFGLDAAQAYADANQAAIEWVAEFDAVTPGGIEFERLPAFTYATDEKQLRQVEREVEAAGRLELPASFVASPELPFETAGAICFEGQARFHPHRLCRALAEAVEGDGSRVFETTRATGVDDDEPCRVSTEHGELEAGRVVVATHIPFLDRGLLFAKAHPRRAYALGVRLDGPVPAGMYLSAGQPTRSLRPVPVGDEEILIVGGEGHKVGTGDERERYAALERFAHEHFAVRSIDWRWSTQDYFPVDGVPYIGRLTPRTKRVFTATGFKGWGLTHGVVAGMLLTELVAGRDHPWRELYDPHRATPVASAKAFVKENAEVGAHFVVDRITHRGNPRCTHLGCLLAFNEAEETWDCPCHGSRFSLDGEVLQGPAVAPLELGD